jgi:hypothetical protein
MTLQTLTGKLPTERPPDPENVSPGAVAARGASKIDQLGGKVDPEDSHPSSFTQGPIRAQLNGWDRCSAFGITATGSAPVLALCRLLIEAGHHPATPLEVYRGGILCLRVRSIGEAARLRVATHGVGFEPGAECTGGSPVRQNTSPLVGVKQVANRARSRPVQC